jgi:hypothetical protein
MPLDLGGRLGFAGLIVALFGIAAFYLWPDKKWIGLSSLIAAGALVIAWGIAEARQAGIRSKTALATSIVIGVVIGGGLGATIWQALQKSSENVNPATAETHPTSTDQGASHQPQPPGEHVGHSAGEAPQLAPLGGFTLAIDGVRIEPSASGDTVVELAVSIHNAGEPSLAHNWKLSIRLSSGNLLAAHHLPGRKPRSETTITGPLDERLGNSPLLSNGEASGSLSFIVPEVAPILISRKETRDTTVLLLSVQDKDNRTWVTHRALSSFPEVRPAKGAQAEESQQPQFHFRAPNIDNRTGEVETALMNGSNTLYDYFIKRRVEIIRHGLREQDRRDRGFRPEDSRNASGTLNPRQTLVLRWKDYDGDRNRDIPGATIRHILGMSFKLSHDGINMGPVDFCFDSIVDQGTGETKVNEVNCKVP